MVLLYFRAEGVSGKVPCAQRTTIRAIKKSGARSEDGQLGSKVTRQQQTTAAGRISMRDLFDDELTSLTLFMKPPSFSISETSCCASPCVAAAPKNKMQTLDSIKLPNELASAIRLILNKKRNCRLLV